MPFSCDDDDEEMEQSNPEFDMENSVDPAFDEAYIQATKMLKEASEQFDRECEKLKHQFLGGVISAKCWQFEKMGLETDFQIARMEIEEMFGVAPVDTGSGWIIPRVS